MDSLDLSDLSKVSLDTLLLFQPVHKKKKITSKEGTHFEFCDRKALLERKSPFNAFGIFGNSCCLWASHFHLNSTSERNFEKGKVDLVIAAWIGFQKASKNNDKKANKHLMGLSQLNKYLSRASIRVALNNEKANKLLLQIFLLKILTSIFNNLAKESRLT